MIFEKGECVFMDRRLSCSGEEGGREELRVWERLSPIRDRSTLVVYRGGGGGGWFWYGLRSFLLALGLVVLLRVFVVELFVVSGSSMWPTMETRQVIVVEKVSLWFFPIHRQSIIVFRHPLKPWKRLVKRVIALGGERVWIRSGRVYINGRRLEERYLHCSFSGNFGPFLVPAGSYFVLGDNRDHSVDSRYGWVVRWGDIVGVCRCRFWPFSRFRFY
ncbi:MAG: signal peptidase I [Planctomycetota bacterium]|nr:MAG: signal peptidase I [Planctomycetota bacterium]